MELTLRSFKALSSTTRILMLRELKRRRMTTTELANLLKIHVTTAKEHLQVLNDAELVVMEDDGHKWKYYALTQDGQEIVSPYTKEIKIMLFLSFLLIGVGLLGFSPFQFASLSGSSTSMLSEDIMMAPAAGGGAEIAAIEEAATLRAGEEPMLKAAASTDIAEPVQDSAGRERIPYTNLVLIFIGALGAGVAIGMARSRLRLPAKR